MSMIGYFLATTPDQLAEFISDPSTIIDYLIPDDDPAPSNLVDIEKSWHAIHYTLNGQPWGGEGPLSLAILGGEPIGENHGYGPTRYLGPHQVRSIAAALSEVTPQMFSAKFDPRAMDEANIYPFGWEANSHQNLDYVLWHYIQLTDFYANAAKRRDAVLLCLL